MLLFARTASEWSKDPGIRRVLDSEARLFHRYGLAHTVHWTRPCNGGPLRYVVVGRGKPIVFLHGVGIFSAHWAPLLSCLRRRRCVALDVPGISLSDALDWDRGSFRRRTVEVLHSMLTSLGLSDAPVVATSYGAMLMLWLAADAGLPTPAMAVLGSPGLALPGIGFAAVAGRIPLEPVARSAAFLRPLGRGMTRLVLGSAVGRQAMSRIAPEMVDAAHALFSLPRYRVDAWKALITLVGMRAAGETPSLTDEELKGIDVPTLFLWGSKDVYLKPDRVRRAIELMPHARLSIVESGHAPWFDDPVGCARAIEEHLQRYRG